MTNQVFKSVCF